MAENFKKEYRDLEMKVLASLRGRIQQSKQQSKHMSGKAIKVDVNGYQELVIVNDNLTFIDSRGLHYSVFTVPLEELIDILG